MKRKVFLFFILFLCVVKCIAVTGKAMASLLQLPGLKPASVGYCLLSPEGKIIDAYAEEKVLLPASVLKLVTTSTVLEMYGPAHRFVTQVSYTGDIFSDGVLHGDLVIQGGGDPMLGSEFGIRPVDSFLQELVIALKEKGIKNIKGRILGDDSLFDNEGVSHKWLWEDLGNYYAAGSYGLNYRDNLYRLVLRSGKSGTKPLILKTIPVMKELSFVNYLVAKNNNADSVYIYGAPFSDRRYLYGSLPAGRSSFTVKGDIPDPAFFLVKTITDALVANHISVSGAPDTYRRLVESGKKIPVGGGIPILRFESDPLSHIVSITNKRSNNLFAETLLRQVALKKYDTASAGKGISVLCEYWKSKGLDISALQMYDGSGLAVTNRISPLLLATILKQESCNDDFVYSLPEAGVEGTVKNLMKNSGLQGTLLLKSGSMAGVQCYAGYYIIASKRYPIVFMVNNFTCGRAELKAAIERFLKSSLSLL
ncbi:D-alanyl-D-alanine carboxypeptidase/D-alanyl-D-alanine endopeptidase [Coprobacter tertius]|uniref:D-alanyl-D-alanine carboxypeptidase/D-alanyl-D-alanine-endopeptidase n=1 Tax=Coprobacter tertius TaxID=2944915 RepID=A0ABT1MFP4_9BACT|nr:D-alanyl-D-alanine carboxypeptidase/D-alanyl-D-alanine-endopeptidase [Coprobacter tertius]MCP9611161.1 D-alanyl-D-alanine carboxypeptidase/D-alanyl-D-alanine-endopeptidase [Coprobacter tertius]